MKDDNNDVINCASEAEIVKQFLKELLWTLQKAETVKKDILKSQFSFL